MDLSMTAVFWFATIVMAVLAYAFVAAPLLKNQRRRLIGSLAVALPLLAIGLYVYLGTPPVNNPASTQMNVARNVQTESQADSQKEVASVASMVDGLAERLRENPDDGEGWLLLAKSYRHVNQIDEAIFAYEKAAALGQRDTELAALAGSGTDSQAQIFGNVRLSDEAMNIVMDDDTVFIFARAVNGPPMPVAVLQRPASELPIDFLLNDSQSMVAGVKLSDFDRVTVTARISRSGNATDALQGLEANTGNIVVSDNEHLNLIIAKNNN